MAPDYRLIWIVLALVAGVFLWTVFHVATNPYDKSRVDVQWQEAAQEVLDGWLGNA